MLLSIPLFALEALTFLSLATTSVAGHARLRHLQPRHPRISNLKGAPRADSRRSIIDGRDTPSVAVTMGDLQLLQQESTAFAGWMNSWFASSQSLDPATSAVQLKQELQAYQGWINAWLDSAMNSSSAPPVPAPVPVTSPVRGASVSLALPTTLVSPIKATRSTPIPAASVSSPAVAQIHSGSPSLEASTSVTAGQFFQAPNSAPHPSAVPQSTPAPVVPKPQSSEAASSPAAIASQSPISQPAASTPAPSPIPTLTSSQAQVTHQSASSSGSYTFNADSSSNVAVYYGQSGATGEVSLGSLCQDSSVDIVVLAFLTTFFGPAGMPSINLGSSCGGQTSQMASMGATGLMSCPTLASQITTCQNVGKKVLLSLGGSLATSAFSSDDQATQFASTIWNLFGAGTGVDAALRPFGSVKVDGFDVDNEDHSTAFYSTFVSALRKNLDSDSSKTYYISAAPQCPRPDASIPLDAMQTMDFIFVQFYNNGDCNIGQPGFDASFKAWSADLSANGKGPRLFIGAPGCSSCAGSGYVEPGQVQSVLEGAIGAGVGNLGGVMLWDGPEAMVNTVGGTDYLTTVKEALG